MKGVDENYEKETTEYRDMWQRWDMTPLPDPIPDNIKACMKEDLVQNWRYEQESFFRTILWREWIMTEDGAKPGCSSYGETVFRLTSMDLTSAEISKQAIRYCCNKPTALYVTPSGWHQGYPNNVGLPGMMFGAIYQEWFRCHGGEPNIGYWEFFMNAIRLTEQGPSTVSGILDAHLSLCRRIDGRIDAAAGRVDNLLGRTSKDERNLQLCGFDEDKELYRFHPLYRAIFLIADRQDGYEGQDSETGWSMGQYCDQQTVVIVRTGVEDGLSAPVSLDSLRPHSLPLAAPGLFDDATTDVVVDAVRAPLVRVVRFVTDLWKRENDALLGPDYQPPIQPKMDDLGQPDGVDLRATDHPDTYADAVIAAADKMGYEQVWPAAQSVRRLQARAVGQSYMEFDHMPFQSNWKP